MSNAGAKESSVNSAAISSGPAPRFPMEIAKSATFAAGEAVCADDLMRCGESEPGGRTEHHGDRRGAAEYVSGKFHSTR